MLFISHACLLWKQRCSSTPNFTGEGAIESIYYLEGPLDTRTLAKLYNAIPPQSQRPHLFPNVVLASHQPLCAGSHCMDGSSYVSILFLSIFKLSCCSQWKEACDTNLQRLKTCLNLVLLLHSCCLLQCTHLRPYLSYCFGLSLQLWGLFCHAYERKLVPFSVAKLRPI